MTARRTRRAVRAAYRRIALVGRSHRAAVGKRMAELEIWLARRGVEVSYATLRRFALELGWRRPRRCQLDVAAPPLSEPSRRARPSVDPLPLQHLDQGRAL